MQPTAGLHVQSVVFGFLCASPRNPSGRGGPGEGASLVPPHHRLLRCEAERQGWGQAVGGGEKTWSPHCLNGRSENAFVRKPALYCPYWRMSLRWSAARTKKALARIKLLPREETLYDDTKFITFGFIPTLAYLCPNATQAWRGIRCAGSQGPPATATYSRRVRAQRARAR